MRVLINFSTLKLGGGQNVALNFLHALNDLTLEGVEFYFFVAKNSAAHIFLIKNGNFNFTILSNNPIKRILFELFLSKKILVANNIDIIYTYFGIGMFAKRIPQVSGSADSNLYFPEIDFWSHYKGIPRFKKWLIDTYRLWGIKRASAVIFENKIMEERSKVLFGLKKTAFIKPSINIKVDSKEFKLFEDNRIPKGLFLCGWQLNKNIMLIPEIAFRLKQLSIDFQFVITAPKDNSREHNQFVDKMKSLDVIDYIKIIGPVKKEELASLYEKINFVFLLSKLESFSNNIIEAWYYKRLLIISDELWAKSICKDAALYVDRDNVNFIAKTIQLLIENDMIKKNIIENGEKEILNYPTIKERTIEEINFIKKIYESN
jgi:glycosyltransferase involved in cell wall biosynthesis